MNRRYARLGAIVVGLIAFALSALRGPLGAQSDELPSVERGQHVATALAGCAECHGANFAGGRAFARGGATVYAANLTTGAGGISAQSDAEIRRTIRTGIKADDTHLRVMPWREYAVMTDRDVDSVIAFIRSLPAVDNVVPAATRAAIPASAGSELDRPGSLSGAAYLVRLGGCTSCHGANFAGGISPAGAAVPNISRVGIGSWSFADFQTAMRTGKTPAGHELSAAMPWSSVGRMTDDELRSVYDYLESRPLPADAGN